MPHATPGRLACQVESLRRQVAQTPGLPFGDVLDADMVERVLEQEEVQGNACVFTPLVTVRCLLSQATDADGSCQQAVDRLLAERAAQELPEVSANTGAYCQARKRLAEGVLRQLVRRVGKELLLEAPVAWLWQASREKIQTPSFKRPTTGKVCVCR